MNKFTKKILIISNSYLFIKQHLNSILEDKKFETKIYIVTKLKHDSFYKLSNVNYINIDIERNISWHDFKTLISYIFIRLKIRPNISLSFTPKAGFINALTATLPGKTIHYFTGQRWVTFKGLKKLFFKFIDFFIVKSSLITYCDSPSQSKFISKNLLTKPPKVINFGSISGVDTKKFIPKKSSTLKINNFETQKFQEFMSFLPNESKSKKIALFGYVGRINKDKGISFLLETFIIHLKKYPKNKLVLIGPIEMPKKDLKIIKDYPNSILHIDFTAHIYLYYPFLTGLVLPSYREGFGSVLIEAAACKIPSICSKIPGPIDYISHLKNGYFIKKNSKKDLLYAFEFFSKNKKR